VSARGLFEGLNTPLFHKTLTLHTLYIVASMLHCCTIKKEQYKLTMLHKNITVATAVISKVFGEIRN
jgi:hypothetical protein